jgi:probable F420-dependent oxidoreductase
MAMRIGLALPHYDFSFPDHQRATWPRIVEAARRAERLGFDSIWVSDHFFLDLARYGGSAEAAGTPEPFTALAALAVATERVRLGTLVACAPFRHPAHVAKMATTIDLTSHGRFDLGIGAGWYEREFEAFGYERGGRFAYLEESVEVVAGLFGGGPVDHRGRRFRLRGALNHPKPAQPGGPPIWIGGKGGDRTLRLVARGGLGWNTVWRWEQAAYASRVAALRAAWLAEGRDPAEARLSIGLYTLVADDERDLAARFAALQGWAPGGALDEVTLDAYARDTMTGTVERCLARLTGLAELGVEEFIVGAGPVPFAVADWDQVELIADRLLPAAHAL